MQTLSKICQSNVTAIAILAVGLANLYGCTSQPNQTYQFQVGDEFRITYRSNKADEFVDKNRLKVNGAIIDFSYKVKELSSSSVSPITFASRAREVRRSDFVGDWELINSIEINDVPGDDQATITFQYATKEGGQMVAVFNLKGDVFAPVSPKSLRKAVSGILQNGDGCSSAEVIDIEINQLQFSKNGQPIEVSSLPYGLSKRLLVADGVENCQGFVGTILFYRYDENNQLNFSPHISRLLWTQQIFEGELQAISSNMFSDAPYRTILFTTGPLIPGQKISELAFTVSPFIEETKKSDF